eukprot:TRINITY_DN9496_c0_g1_i1.p1 TRINITY_DN9496_c0_g1~~TRINITY_DN9496_c0_g1_i1.p1  ORF type:complete len:504 (-),score=151.09 TRINITY_DN9496_c0_g1_i1:33-1544(-)
MLLRQSVFTSTPLFNSRRSSRNVSKRSYRRNYRKAVQSLRTPFTHRFYATETAQKVETAPLDNVTSAPLVGDRGSYGIAFNSPSWTKYFADVLATEAEIPVAELTAQGLSDLYAKQLQDYTNAKDTIMKEGVSEETYEGLRQIYVLRASLHLDAIQKGLDICGIDRLKKKGFTGTIGSSFTDNGTVEEAKSSWFGTLKKARKEGVPFTPVFAKNLLSGISGLVKALDKGLTSDQLAKSKSILGSDSGEIVQMDTPLPTVKSSSQYEDRIELLKQGKITEAYPKPEGASEEELKTYNEFIAQQTEIWKNPEEAEANIELTQLAANSDLPQAKHEEFLANFSDKSVKDNESDIKRITIYNPVAETLFGHNLMALAVPGVEYTDDYAEYSGGKMKTGDPSETRGRKNYNETEFLKFANVVTGDPIVAAEEIMDVKLDRLAGFYGLNLENDLDNLKFHVFMDKYEVSPGEMTLEWVLTYPPAQHTFDELPIVKIPSDEDVEDYYKQQ